MINISKGKGWYKHSKEHSLAAKGIKSKTDTLNPPPTSVKTPIETIDTDKDGIPDYRDCDPYDITKQDTRLNKTQLAILESKPLYVTDDLTFSAMQHHSEGFFEDKKLYNSGISSQEPNPKEHHLYKFPSNQSKKNAREAHYRLMAMLKKYPTVFNAVANSDAEHILFTSKNENSMIEYGRGDDETMGRYDLHRNTVLIREPEIANDFSARQMELYIIQTYGKDTPQAEIWFDTLVDSMPFPEEDMPTQESKKRRSIANSLQHELRHADQRKVMDVEDFIEQKRKYKYEDQPFEIDAHQHATHKIKELEKPGKLNATIDEGLKTQEEREKELAEEMIRYSKKREDNL